MRILRMLLLGAAALPVCLHAVETADTIGYDETRNLNLNEVMVVAPRQSIRQKPDRIVYTPKNDPYAVGLSAIGLLDRIPRITVNDDNVSVAGKGAVRYILDGHLVEMSDEALILKLKNLQADNIEKIELLTTPPGRYAAGDNIAYISITTRNETLGTRGNVWGRLKINEQIGYMGGGSVSHSTRKVEFSADASYNDARGQNDFIHTYMFDSYTRVSDRRNRFVWRTLGANGTFRYKFSPTLGAGAIINFSANPIRSDISDITTAPGISQMSSVTSPAKPDNALTLTAFADWALGSDGKMLSLTYNYFDRNTRSFSDISTLSGATLSLLSKDASNDYRIHSAKLDATLPLKFLKVETGAAYTHIDNATSLTVADMTDGQWVTNMSQSNDFKYAENTAALYVSAERNFTPALFAKIALRGEHTGVKGINPEDNTHHDTDYFHLFPTVNISYNTGIGRFSADYSTGIIRPQFGDLNPFRYYTTVTEYFTGNPDLKPALTHNAGLNYSYKGIYAVLYGSWNDDAVGYITRFHDDGMQSTMPENCLNTLKTGIYASYSRSFFGRWNINAGGELYYSSTKSDSKEFKEDSDSGLSGKIELNTSLMLTRDRNLVLNLRGSYLFPWHDRMFSYDANALFSCELRYMLLHNRLTLTASVTDPFGWNVTKYTARFKDYTLRSRTDIHYRSFALRVAWSFGRDKVNNVYRDTKERESGRSN